MGKDDNYREVRCCANCKYAVSISEQTYAPDDYECEGSPVDCYMICDKYEDI